MKIFSNIKKCDLALESNRETINALEKYLSVKYKNQLNQTTSSNESTSKSPDELEKERHIYPTNFDPDQIEMSPPSRKNSSKRFKIEPTHQIAFQFVFGPDIYFLVLRNLQTDLAKSHKTVKLDNNLSIQILKRLMNKQEMWNINRKQLANSWRDSFSGNYLKSLDYADLFRENDEKCLKAEHLLGKIKTNENLATVNMNDNVVKYRVRSVLKDAADLIMQRAKRSNGSREDKELMQNVINGFLADFIYANSLNEQNKTNSDESLLPKTVRF